MHSSCSHAAPFPINFVSVEAGDYNLSSTHASCSAVCRMPLLAYHPRYPLAIRLPTECQKPDPRKLSTAKSSSSEYHIISLFILLMRVTFIVAGIQLVTSLLLFLSKVFHTTPNIFRMSFPTQIRLAKILLLIISNTAHFGQGSFVNELKVGHHSAYPKIALDVNCHEFSVLTSTQVSYIS